MEDRIRYDRGLFAGNLLRLMEQHQEKQSDIARLLKVSKSTVSGYCSAQQLPRMDKIEQLALHYGVSRAALLGEAEPFALSELCAPLNARGRAELARYARYLASLEEYRGE